MRKRSLHGKHKAREDGETEARGGHPGIYQSSSPEESTSEIPTSRENAQGRRKMKTRRALAAEIPEHCQVPEVSMRGGMYRGFEIEVVKVFDGNSSLQRRMFRQVTVSRAASVKEFLTAAMRAFHVPQDTTKTYLTDAYSAEEVELEDPLPVTKLTKKDGKRPAVFLRYREKDNDEGTIRVYPSRLGAAVTIEHTGINVTSNTVVTEVIGQALKKFGLPESKPQDYRLVEVMLDKGVSERVMESTERPWELLKAVGRDSIRQMEMTRFYLQLVKDPHGPSIALFVGNLPPNQSQRQYENILTDILAGYKYSSIGPIYYEYGSMVITYEDSDLAVRAFYTLRESSYEDKTLLVMLLPNILPHMISEGVQPLLVFVNVKSGGCQGLELISSFRKLLNPYQVFDLDNGGPLPGLYVFRHVKNYKILVCGGDGTIGWVLQCLDNVGQDSECQSPACAIVPLGTGNDLARVLRWGPGYNGGEDPINLLKDVIDAENVRLDRWTVVFHVDEKVEDKQPLTTSIAASTSEDNTQIFVMNNYFGIGIEAELCLDFHNAREENPNKFNSRLHNKGVYVKMGLRKMVSRKLCKDLHKEIRLEVDGKHVELPPVEGIIILNILSWGSGANPWGPEKDDQFNKPNHWDGHLEVVGVTGIVHLGQIQSGLRSAIRIAQGGHIRIKLNSELPVQVDGEPWNQAPGEVVVLKSALKSLVIYNIFLFIVLLPPPLPPLPPPAHLLPQTLSHTSWPPCLRKRQSQSCADGTPSLPWWRRRRSSPSCRPFGRTQPPPRTLSSRSAPPLSLASKPSRVSRSFLGSLPPSSPFPFSRNVVSFSPRPSSPSCLPSSSDLQIPNMTSLPSKSPPFPHPFKPPPLPCSSSSALASPPTSPERDYTDGAGQPSAAARNSRLLQRSRNRLGTSIEAPSIEDASDCSSRPRKRIEG
ncbi:putative diacylglycerol kinase theta isoform X6 [Penaeus vannamei]|uniref:Diacylglycerol kinase n=1 Tax=Penaeus vannamei TaxID=6689 RepID=A0A423SG12_PENVA|nr:putative diacylglycerol kinase theta isoform X6 [Penaeus vannamei]